MEVRSDDRRCSEVERGTLLAHLLEDRNAHWCAKYLADRALEAWRRSISRDELGNLPTVWGDLGGQLTSKLFGREKFLVREVMAVLGRPERPDETLRKALAERMASERLRKADEQDDHSGALPQGMLLCDGNKRAVTLFETSRESGGPVPIFILRLAISG